MSLSLFKVLPKNPNCRSGCACSPHGKRADCKPPYVAWTATECHDPRNPVFVIGFKCLQSAMAKASRAPQGAAELRRQNPPAPEPAPEPAPVAPTIAELLSMVQDQLAEQAT